MVKIAAPRKGWQRGLPIADALTLVDALQSMMGVADGTFSLQLSLTNGLEIHAQSVEELRADIADVRGDDIEYFEFIYVRLNDITVSLRGTPPHRSPEDGDLKLAVSDTGDDETKIRGVFARMEMMIEKAFAVIDDYEEQQAANGDGSTASISIGTLSVNSGTVAISGIGDVVANPSARFETTNRDDTASEPSNHSAASEPPSGARAWWNNVWLVAIIGGALAAVIAGLVLYWILN